MPTPQERLRHAFSPTVNLTLRGDVGGFDVGSKLSLAGRLEHVGETPTQMELH